MKIPIFIGHEHTRRGYCGVFEIARAIVSSFHSSPRMKWIVKSRTRGRHARFTLEGEGGGEDKGRRCTNTKRREEEEDDDEEEGEEAEDEEKEKKRPREVEEEDDDLPAAGGARERKE